MQFQVVDGRAAVLSRELHVVLFRSKWDDYGYRTTFSLSVSRNGIQSEIGDIKILRKGQRSGDTAMPEGWFTRLEDCCSLGQSFSFYERLIEELGREQAQGVLADLGDIAISPDVRTGFAHEPGLEISLLRNDSAVNVLETVGDLFTARRPVREAPDVSLGFATSVGGSDFEIKFDFGGSTQIPKRICAVIGYNGTGKTRLLGNLAMVATADKARRSLNAFQRRYGRFFGHTPAFGAVITVSYSAFDTFPLPDWTEATRAAAASDNTEEAFDRVATRGELFGHVYAGLREVSRQHDDPLLNPSWRLKSQDEINREFADALRSARAAGTPRRRLLNLMLTQLRNEPSFRRIAPVDVAEGSLDAWLGEFQHFSTGHKIVLNIAVRLAAHLQPNSLVLIDEPESHLHPPLLASLLRVLSAALTEYSSIAVVATHSPVVLQEVPARCVRILRRFGNRTFVESPSMETFGANVGTLTRSVFDLDNSASDFHEVLSTLARDHQISDIEEMFGYSLDGQALAFLIGLQERNRQ